MANPANAVLSYSPVALGRWDATSTIRVVIQAAWPDSATLDKEVIVHRPENCASVTPTPTLMPSPEQSPTATPSSTAPAPTSFPSPTPHGCIGPTEPDSIVILFNGESIRADKSEAKSITGPFPAQILPGTYRITLVSYDNHIEHSDVVVQEKEQWRLILSGSQGATVATTSAISDLPEDQNWLVEIVGETLALEQEVSTVTAKHDAYPDDNPNSITPVCAVLDLIPTAPDE